MTRRIKKVAIIGSGIMGSGIACHFANIGVEVLLLDIVPRELTDKEKAKGLTLEDKVIRKRIVNDALTASLKSKPSPIYNQKFDDNFVRELILKIPDMVYIYSQNSASSFLNFIKINEINCRDWLEPLWKHETCQENDYFCSKKWC